MDDPVATARIAPPNQTYYDRDMGRGVAIAIVAVAAVGGGGLLWKRQDDQRARQAVDASLVDARAAFKELAMGAVAETEDEGYRRRLLTALLQYEETLETRVYGERPQLRDPDAYRRRMERQLDELDVPAAERPGKLEGFEIVKAAYDKLASGTWKSVLTQAGAGNTRLDVYQMRRIVTEDGRPMLEGRFFFWGLDDEARVDWGQLEMRLWRTVEKTVGRGRRRRTQEVAEVYGKIQSDDGPRVYIDAPNRYIAEFPPYVAVGYLHLPVMPSEVDAFDLTLRYRVKKAGVRHDAELKWTKMPIPPRWQLSPGQRWEADVIEATEDEIAGKDRPSEEG